MPLLSRRYAAGKVLASLAAMSAKADIAGHSIPYEAGCRPLALPRPESAFRHFFDKLVGRLAKPPHRG